MEDRDVVVIGGGPAGYVAALRAAQLGAQVTVVEESVLGGTCINRGCIPTKSLLHSADVYESFQGADQLGIDASGVGLNLSRMQSRKNAVVSRLVAGVTGRLKRSKVEVISGRARLGSSKQIEVDLEQGKKRQLQARVLIIAAGSKPIVLPVPGADARDIMGTDDLLGLDHVPKSIAIVGGGVIGLEMATIVSRLGCRVHILEMMPRCIPNQDPEVVAVLEDILRADGIEIQCSARVSRIEDVKGGKRVVFSDGQEEQGVEAASVAVCVGYKPNTEGLGLEECGVATDNGAIRVDERMQTNVPGIYAAGDAVGGIMLAHVGYAEGRVAAENAMGLESRMDYQAVPQCIFTLPEVASVGLTEEEARSQGHDLQIGRFPFVGNGMATILDENRGLVKIVAERKYGQVLGVHIVGPRATGLIPEAALAIRLEATAADIIATMHAHPTLSEAVWEAALDVVGETLHYSSSNR